MPRLTLLACGLLLLLLGGGCSRYDDLRTVTPTSTARPDRATGAELAFGALAALLRGNVADFRDLVTPAERTGPDSFEATFHTTVAMLAGCVSTPVFGYSEREQSLLVVANFNRPCGRGPDGGRLEGCTFYTAGPPGAAFLLRPWVVCQS